MLDAPQLFGSMMSALVLSQGPAGVPSGTVRSDAVSTQPQWFRLGRTECLKLCLPRLHAR